MSDVAGFVVEGQVGGFENDGTVITLAEATAAATGTFKVQQRDQVIRQQAILQNLRGGGHFHKAVVAADQVPDDLAA